MPRWLIVILAVVGAVFLIVVAFSFVILKVF
jgi:hypothetical protein